jgi:hypothetical protein
MISLSFGILVSYITDDRLNKDVLNVLEVLYLTKYQEKMKKLRQKLKYQGLIIRKLEIFFSMSPNEKIVKNIIISTIFSIKTPPISQL